MNYPNYTVHSKPAPVKDLVKRQRLETTGQRIPEYQVTTVIAPAGYGKTVWVASLLGSPDWPPSVWIALDRQDGEPSMFLHHFIRSVNAVFPNTSALRTLWSLQSFENEWQIAAAAFVEGLPQDGQIILVLDDVDFIYGHPLNTAIMEFSMEHLPENVHLVMIGRNTPPYRLYRLEIKNQLLRIGSRELLFSEEEARALFANMKLMLSESEAAALFARTEGWAVGLRLLGIYLQQPGNSLGEALQSLQREDSSFYLYIMNEFLGAMPADLKNFLLDASLLPYMDARLCDAALIRTDAAAMLHVLRGYGLLFPVDEGKGSWRMHHLVGEWLVKIAEKQRAAGDIRAIRERAADFFEQNGDVNRAVEQCIAAGSWEKAATLIHRHGNEYIAQGYRMDMLYKWIGELPEELVEGDCWLLYFKGMGILNVDDPRAFQLLSTAADMAGVSGDIKCEAQAIWSTLLPAIFSGDVAKGERAGRRLMDNPELMENPLSRREALAAALQYAMARDSLLEGLELSRQVLRDEIPGEMGMWARYTTGYLLLRVGRLVEARRMIEETLAMPYVQENERRIIVGYEALMDITFIQGDFDALEMAGQHCLALGGKYGMAGILGRVYYLMAHRHYREGHFSEARRDFNQAYEYFTSAGTVHFANQTAIDILLLRIGGGENARELFLELQQLQSRFENVPYGLGIDYMVNSLAGIAAMETGDLPLARRLLEKSTRRWQEIGARISLCSTEMLLSHVLMLQGEEEACDELLRKALSEAEANGWENFWEWHPKTMYTICRRAIQKKIHPKWAVRSLLRWFPEQSRRGLGLLLASQDRPLAALAADFFRQSFQAAGKTVLTAFYLGGFRLFVNGVEVSGWKTKKAENLLKYVLTDRSMRSKDCLMQQLWPEGDPDSNEGRLRMTLSYVRKALAAAGLQPESIAVSRGTITLDPALEIYCDYEIFMQEARKALDYARAGHPYAIPALEQATRIYAGEYLPENIYEDATANLRSALYKLHLEVMAALASCQLKRNNLAAALQACYDCLAREPVDEAAARMAMYILWKMDKKHQAMELYRRLAATLAREYDTVPEQETAALNEKIQSGCTP